MYSYLITYWQPLLLLIIGVCVLLFVGYINWHDHTKSDVVSWVAKIMFRNNLKSEMSAQNAFMVITSILLAMALIWIGIASLYLTH